MTEFDWTQWTGNVDEIPAGVDYSSTPYAVRELIEEEIAISDAPAEVPRWISSMTGIPDRLSWSAVADRERQEWAARSAEAAADALEAAVNHEYERQLPRVLGADRAREAVARMKADEVDRWTLEDIDVEASAFVDEPMPDPLVTGVLNREELFRILGPSGVGKSFVALDLAMSVATGQSWGGGHVVPAPGLVYYVVAEGQHGFKARIRAWAVKHNEGAVPSALRIIKRPVQLLGTKFDDLIARLEAHRPAMVVFDTQHRVTVGVEENNATDAGVPLQRLAELCSRTGAAVGLVHHTPKDNPDRARGSSSWEAAMDLELVVRASSGGGVEAYSRKSKDAEDGTVLGTWEIATVPIPPVGHRTAAGALVRRDPMTEAMVLDAEARKSMAVAAWIVDAVKARPGCSETSYYRSEGVARTVLVDGRPVTFSIAAAKAAIDDLVTEGVLERTMHARNRQTLDLPEAMAPEVTA